MRLYFASLLFLFASLSVSAEGLSPGDNLPALTAVNVAGKSVSLDSLKGKITVFEWTNPECPFVKRVYEEELPQSLRKEFAGDSVNWLVVDSTNFSTAEKTGAWLAGKGFTGETLIDLKGELGHAFGAATTPHVFVFNAEGKLAYKGPFDDDSYGEKPVAERTAYVKEAISALQAGQPVKHASIDSYGCSVKYAK